jgi:type VII secretion-associated protein (TIGR03931 family)
MSRVAVQLGMAWLRVAIDDPRPRLLAELPVHGTGSSDALSTALSALLERPADELLVVHVRGRRPRVPSGAAAAVRVVPAALAALGGTPVRAGTPHATPAAPAAWPGEGRPGLLDGSGDAVVVDVGHSGTEIARVAGGRVVVARRLPVGGAVLDHATAALLDRVARRDAAESEGRADNGPGPWAAPRAQIRAARETLSLQPVVRVGAPPVELSAEALRRALAPHLAAVVDGVRRVCAGAAVGRSPPVLLVGGVARTPLLAELLDAAGVADVRVAVRPDAAAVVGALRLPPKLLGPPSPACGGGTVSPFGPSLGPSPVPRGGPPAAFWLPPVPPSRRRPLRGVAGAAAAAVALSGLYAAGAALPAEPGPLAVAGELVQYGYAVRLPRGWAHTGGLPERRRSLLTPTGAPDGGNLISVERSPLGYDADAEPQRARAELRAEFVRAAAGGAPLTGFDDDARFAGRPVVMYREAAGGADAAQVDWYVVLDGDAQLSVGCRHTDAGAAAVAAACATVVASLRRTT